MSPLLPNPVLFLLKEKGLISDEEFQLLKEKSVSPTFVNVDSQVSSSDSVEKLVKGQTTFLDLLDWGMTKTQIEEIMGKPYNSSYSKDFRYFVVLIIPSYPLKENL